MHKYGVYLVAIVALALYYPTISYDYNLDDELVTRGSEFEERGFEVSHYTAYGTDSLSKIFSEPYYKDSKGNSYGFRPITHMTFALEHAIFGASAAASHAVNVVLYALLGVLIGLLIRNLLPEWDPLLAWVVSLLFIVHPMHVEVVASIKNRDEILALLFFLLGWYLILHYRKKPRLSILLGVICFALSIYSKLSLLFMPGVVALYLLRHEKFSLSDVILYTVGTLGVVALRMEWSLGFTLILVTVGLFILYIFHGMWRQENRIWIAHQAKLFYQQFQIFRQTVQNKMPKSGLSTSWKHWSFISGLLLILVSYAGGQYISPILFYALGTVIGFTCLIFWIRIPYYMVLGLLGGLGLQMDFNGHYLALLPLLIYMLSASDEEDDLLHFPQVLGNVWPSVMIFSIVLTASEFWVSRSMINVVLAYALPFGLLPLSMLKAKWSKKLPQIILWFVSICIGLWIVYIINLGPGSMEIMPIYLGLFLSFLPKVGFMDKPFQRIGLGGLLSLIFALFFHILPVIQAPSDAQIAESKNVVESVEEVKRITAKADSIPMSKLGRILDLSENPMVGVNDFSSRMAFTFDNVFHYHRQMLLSTPWSAYYGFGAIGGASWSSFSVLSGLGLLILLLVILIMGWVRGITSWWIGSSIVLLGLLPFVNLFVLMAGGVADRYTFSASLGMIILLVGLLRQFKVLKKQGIILFMGLSIFILAWITYSRTPSWKDKESLFVSSLEQFPEAAKVHYLLADARAGQAATSWESSNKSKNDREIFKTSLNSALLSYTKAISLYSRSEWQEDRNGIYEDLIRLNLELGADEKALELLKEHCMLNALNCAPRYLDLVKILISKGSFEASYQGFLLLIEAEPLEDHFTQYSRILSLHLSSDARVKEILERTLDYGIELYPNSAELYFNYGSLSMTFNDFLKALVYLNKALEIDPQLNDLQRRIAICEDKIAGTTEQ